MPDCTVSPPDKATLRALALARRAALDTDAREACAERAALNALKWLGDVAGEVVSVFAPIGTEISTEPLTRLLRENGAIIALPVVIASNQPLRFRLWAEDVALIPSAGPGLIVIPTPPEDAAEVEPDVLIVPLAAFDARGHRLGYGAGFYDRTLARLRRVKRVEALGYAFAVQELPDLPDEAHDERLDAIATDAGIICPVEE